MQSDTKAKNSEPIQEEMAVFCRNVKMLRAGHGLSKKEMAEILGIGTASLTKLEQGIIPDRVSVSIVIKLSRYFGIKPCKLFVLL